MSVTVAEDVKVKLVSKVSVNDSVSVAEDITPHIPFYLLSVNDSTSVAESIGRTLVCNIKPITITGIQLWSKLNSASDVTSPSTGTGGAEVGSPTYVASKFGNGILSDVNSEGCTFPTAANSINFDKGTIEFWMKVKYAHTDVDVHYSWSFLDTHGISFRRNSLSSQSNFRVAVTHDGGTIDVMATGQTHAVDDLIHWAVTWDRTGSDIGSSKTVAIYKDNVEVASSTTTWNASASFNANLYVGTAHDGTAHSDAVIDNLKTYDVCKTDFTHKDTEGTATGPAESVSVAESITTTGVNNISVNDSVSVTDVDCVQVLALFNLAVNDSITVAENIATPKLSYRPSVFDAVAITELVSSVASLADISVNDAISVAESLVPNLVSHVSVNDSVSLSESVSTLASLADISVYEAVSIIEKVYFEWWQGVVEPTPDWTDIKPDATAWTDIEPDETTWTDVEPDATPWTDIEPDETAWTDV